MKYKLLIFSILACFTSLFSQTEAISIEASLETEAFHRTIVRDSKIYFLRAVKHSEVTEKKFVLTCLESIDLKTIWDKEFIVNQYQNVLKYEFFNNQLSVFFVKHDLDNKLSELSVWNFSPETGELKQNKILSTVEVGDWQNSTEKAEVAQSFISAMDSKQNENEVTPLEYRFGLEFSNDSTRILSYRFDNSQDKLYVDAQVYNSYFELLHQVNYSIDEAHLAYGAKVDSYGEIYQLKVKNGGELVVLKINPSNEVSAYLQIPASSAKKVNPSLFIHKNHQVYVAYCLLKGEKLQGVSVALLDFDKQIVEDSHSHEFDSEFLARQEKHLKNGNHFFELSEIVEQDSKLYLVLEQHFMEGLDVYYEPSASESIDLWHFKTATITTGNLVVLVYDRHLNFLSQNEISKTQKGNNFDGLNTLGHHLVFFNEEAHFIYSNSSKGLVNDELIVQKLDKVSNKWTEFRKIEMEKGNIPVITSCNLLSANQMFVHSRKGLTGKSNFIKVYEF